MRNFGFIVIFLFVFGGCKSDSKKTPSLKPNIQWQKNQYSQLFKIGTLHGDTFLEVFQDTNACIGRFFWGKSNVHNGYSKINQTTHIVSLTAIFSRFIWAINKQQHIVAVDNLKYHCSETFPHTQKVISVNPLGNVNVEQIMKVKPDITFAYYISEQDKKQLQRLNSKSHSIIFIQNHLEVHPLARAEWIRVFGGIFHQSKMSDSLFTVIAKNYNDLKKTNAKGPMVMINLPYSGVWMVPSRKNLMTTLITDAGANPAWLNQNSPNDVNSFQLGIEEAVIALKKSTIWIHPGVCDSKYCIKKIENRIPNTVFDRISCYQNDKKIESTGANPYWDYGALRPDFLLKDLTMLFQSHTEDAYFYRKIE